MKKLLALLLFVSAYAYGANGPSVGVSSITVGSGTITVNTAGATNLTANEAVCLSAPANYCGTVSVINTSSQFVMPATGVAACSSSCGTAVRAPKVVWLATTATSGGYQVSYVLWLTTTQPLPGGGSSSWTGASTAENSALAAGYLIERPRTVFLPAGTTLVNAEAQFQNDFTAQQSALTSSVQPGQYYGNVFDGQGWTQ